MKSKSTAYLLWFFLGLWGAHKFYLNKTGTGILYFFTFGFFGIGWFIDLFTLGSQVDVYNVMFGRHFNNNVHTNHVVVNVPNQQHHAESMSDKLHKLYDLKEKGILTEEEYTAQKAKILSA